MNESKLINELYNMDLGFEKDIFTRASGDGGRGRSRGFRNITALLRTHRTLQIPEAVSLKILQVSDLNN